METRSVDVRGNRTFTVVRTLGEGTFGSVYLADMSSAGGFRRRVALKLLHATWDPQSEAAQRLRDEARLLGRLQHRHIVRVDDLSATPVTACADATTSDGTTATTCPAPEPTVTTQRLVTLTPTFEGRPTSGIEWTFTIGDGGAGALTTKLKAALVELQNGRAPDPHSWLDRVF